MFIHICIYTYIYIYICERPCPFLQGLRVLQGSCGPSHFRNTKLPENVQIQRTETSNYRKIWKGQVWKRHLKTCNYPQIRENGAAKIARSPAWGHSSKACKYHQIRQIGIQKCATVVCGPVTVFMILPRYTRTYIYIYMCIYSYIYVHITSYNMPS